MVNKACPVVFRTRGAEIEVLAFCHPLAGKQFVKGGIKDHETPLGAALRELEEESGIRAKAAFSDIGQAVIGPAVWHFFALETEGLPDQWEHHTQDDFGHVFAFFWHPLAVDLDEGWHLQFHDAFAVMRSALKR